MSFKRLLGDTVLVEILKNEYIGLIKVSENVIQNGVIRAKVLQVGEKSKLEITKDDIVFVPVQFGTRLKNEILYDSEDVIAKLI